MSEETLMLRLPTKWDMTTEEDEKITELTGSNKVQKLEDGFIYVNIKEIVAINEVNDPKEMRTILRMNGNTYSIALHINQLIAVLKRCGVIFKVLE